MQTFISFWPIFWMTTDMQKDSNYSLRWNRTRREAYGYSADLDEGHTGDQLVGLAAAFVGGFLLCLILLGA
jgi:hypothetical protein